MTTVFKVTIEKIVKEEVVQVARAKASDVYFKEIHDKGYGNRSDDELEDYRSGTTNVRVQAQKETRTVIYEQTLQEVNIVNVIAAANDVQLKG